jgi:glycosyltransferase involved in cell wall biosynthesis
VGAAIERIELWLARRAAGLLVLADGMKSFFSAGGVSDAAISVVPTWSLRDAPEISRAGVRSSLGWGETDFICLHGGNMGQKQGLNNVIDSAHLLQQRDSSNIRIVLVGDGNDRRRLEERVRSLNLRNLDFLPMQPTSRYDELVCAADLLLLNQRASVSDMSLPSKLSAYFASGQAVVAAISPGSPAAIEIERAGAGVIVEPSDPQALADALETLQRDPQLRVDMGEKARTYSRKALAPDVILPQYEQFVESLTA